MTDIPLVVAPIAPAKLGTFFSWFLPGNPVDGYFVDTQKIVKWAMPINFYHSRSPDGKYRQGGPWLAEKLVVHFRGPTTSTFAYKGGLGYKGVYKVTAFDDYAALLAPRSVEQCQFDAIAFGGEGYAAIKADKPDFSALTSLYELKDIPHMLQSALSVGKGRVAFEQKRRAKDGNKWWSTYAGEQYLSIQFGYVSLIRDVLDFVDKFRKRDQRYEALVKDNMKAVRRKRTLLDESSSYEEPLVLQGDKKHPLMGPGHVSHMYGHGWLTKVRVESSRRVWVEGASIYYLPTLADGRVNKDAVLRRIMGGRLSMSQLYNMIPWSWLADYFVTVGGVVKANSAGIADHSVVIYGYIMDERKTTKMVECAQRLTSGPDSNWDPVWVPAFRESIHTRKCRVEASPFGWGLRQEDLSSSQIAVLGALGLSNVKDRRARKFRNFISS